MKISYNWLQKYFDEKLPEPEVIADGIIFHSFEVESVENLPPLSPTDSSPQAGEQDTIFDIKILPDRAHDCLSHWGIAKEVSVIFDLKINKKINGEYKKLDDNGGLDISILNENCRRYIGRIVKGVKVGPSPAWLSNALVSIGQKSINNIVDATNYVMFDLGNPIHAFDLDKLASPKIIVESALKDEKFILLDGREVVLDPSILTIRDEKEALVIAGVKGGKKAEIDNNTKNIIIEVANFEPTSVRKTAQKLSIFTDSSKRFENDISPTLAPQAMDEITNLILEIAGGEAYEIVDIYNNKEESKFIKFSQTYLNNLLGVKISESEIDDILNRFGYEYKKEGDDYKVKVPLLRLDMTGSYDFVEEIGRIYGYDKVIPVLPHIDFKIKENKTWVNINNTRNFLISEGYREVMNYAFTNKGDVEIMASASDKNFLRTNLSDGMKKSYELNKLNLPFLGGNEIKIFDLGKVFPKGEEIMNVCFANKKEIIEMSLDKFIQEKVSQEFLQTEALPKEFPRQGLGEQKVFKMWSNYPFISRDIAVWVPEGEDKDKLKNILIEEGTSLLIKEPYLFDSFSKEGRTSYAYRLIFQSYEKTLTDEEINSIMEKINTKISSLGWEVR